MSRAASFVAFLLLAAARVALAQVPWNFTFPATSPMIQYSPYGDGGADGGWTIWSSDVGYNPKDGQTASGTLRRVSNHLASTFSFDFSGSAVYLFGQANASYAVMIDEDNHEVVQGDGLLFAATELELGQHSVMVKLTSTGVDQAIAFEHAVITTSSSQELDKLTFGYNDAQIHYSGSWSDQVIPEASYRETSTLGGSVTLKFNKAVAVAANANMNWGHWLYEVLLDGKVLAQQFNASTHWLVPSTTLFFADNLDPAKDHTLTLKHLGNEDYYKFSISSFDVYALGASGQSSTPSKTNTTSNDQKPQDTESAPPGLTAGAAAGIALGSTLLLIFAILAVFYFTRRSRSVTRGSPQRLAPLLDSEKPSPPASSHSSLHRTGHITPFPPPPTPHRQPVDAEDTLSVPPTMPSTDGGIRPYGFLPRRTRNDKSRRRTGAETETATDGQSTSGSTSPTATERRAVDRVIAMIAERLDQPPGAIIQQQVDSSPPPSYPSMAGR